MGDGGRQQRHSLDVRFWFLAVLVWLGMATLLVIETGSLPHHHSAASLGWQPHRRQLVTKSQAGDAAASSLHDATNDARAAEVREAMAHAFHGYRTYAWGADELHPVSQKPKLDVLSGGGDLAGMGITIVDALSTLHLMGLQEEFSTGRDWIAANMSFEKQGISGFFEAVIRVLGGLLSLYNLTDDRLFLDKAIVLGDRLLPALKAPGMDVLAEWGSNSLEFGVLSRATNDSRYQFEAERVLRHVHAVNPTTYLLPRETNRFTGQISTHLWGIGNGADSYIEYLLKFWVLGEKQDDHWRDRWVHVAEEAVERLEWPVPGRPNTTMIADVRRTGGRGTPTYEIHHLSCFWPGNVALGVMSGAVSGERAARLLQHAAHGMQACYALYNETATGTPCLGAEQARFNANGGLDIMQPHYHQRPEVVESLFYMWRATRDPKYREWGWHMFSAIQKHCRVPGGYTGVVNVMQDPPQPDDVTQSWFYAETLKYFWLLFSPDSALDLSRWVMNTEAHPLKVGRLFAYDAAAAAA